MEGVRESGVAGAAAPTDEYDRRPPSSSSRAAAAAAARRAIVTPSKPRTPNPYLAEKRTYSTPSSSNPYKKFPSSAAATPPAAATMARTAPARRNPYAERASKTRASTPPRPPLCSYGAKRTLDFSGEGMAASGMAAASALPAKRMSPPRRPSHSSIADRRCNRVAVSSSMGAAFDPSVEFLPSIDTNEIYTLHFDGGSRGNPGVAGAGMVLYDRDDVEVWSGGKYLGEMETNNAAEYSALLSGLECSRLLGVRRIRARGDSDLVVKQVSGRWDCRKPHLRRLLQEVLNARRGFEYFDISHVRRDANRRADGLANDAMDERATNLGAVDSLKTPPSSQELSEPIASRAPRRKAREDCAGKATDGRANNGRAMRKDISASTATDGRDGSHRKRSNDKAAACYENFDNDLDDDDLAELLSQSSVPSEKSAQKQVREAKDATEDYYNFDSPDDDADLAEFLSQPQCAPARNHASEKEDDDAYARSQYLTEKNNWMARLPFLVQFEIERLNLKGQSRWADNFSGRLKKIYDTHEGKLSLTRELISSIYEEIEPRSTVAAPYDDFLKRCSNNGSSVDEGSSCLFLFHAKLSGDDGTMELLPPERSDVSTRRIHRRYGSHRFLDLRCDERCTESLVVLKKHLKKHLNEDNELELAGRRYGLLYSNPSGNTVVFRLFAESGVGIDKCDEISAPEVAARCIPVSLNQGLSLAKYMKRMKLSFTVTVPSLTLEAGMLEEIKDIQADRDDSSIMTDGSGLISREALNKVYSQYTTNLEQRHRSLGSTNPIFRTDASCPYSSFQGRIGGIKGMFVVDDSLDGVVVQYRPSQLKYETPMTKSVAVSLDKDNAMHNTVDVKEWDKPPPHAHLCQNTVQLLEERGVPKEFFLSLAKKEIDELESLPKDYESLMRKYKARKYLRDSHCIFEDDVLMRMLYARVPLDEPVMMRKINDFIISELKLYREKSRFPVTESRYLRMLPDHTGLLREGEAYAALGDESAQYEIGCVGSIVAMRLPSYFKSDLRKLKYVSKSDLNQRCPQRGRFFSGIVAAIVLSTKGVRSEAEMMSGGDFDGDKAWVCWNEVFVKSVHELPGHNAVNDSSKDPFKERTLGYSNPTWTNLIINYTMQHRHDRKHLGKLVKTLEMMRDNPAFGSHEVDDIAKKAFIQVDNPHKPQWNEDDQIKYGSLPKPHWFPMARAGNTYQSKKVLGQLFDMFDLVGGKEFKFSEIELEMNVHIRGRIEEAEKKSIEKVNAMRKDMRNYLLSFNKLMADRIRKCDQKDEVEARLKSKAISGLYKQQRLDLQNTYKDEGSYEDVFAILYEQTYFASREKMQRFNEKPYVFAWEVGHDYLTRIIADGDAVKNGGIGIAPTVARGNDRLLFGRPR